MDFLRSIFTRTGDHKIEKPVEKHVHWADDLINQNLQSSPPTEDLPKNTEKYKALNNTLGSVAKRLSIGSMYLGMAIKGLGKTAGLVTMGATAAAVSVPAGLVGLASAGLTYGASRTLGEGHETAKNRASVAGAGAGVVTATALSLIAVPISMPAWVVKQIGIALMKPAGKENVPKPFKAFDESFSTHILPLFGRIGKGEAPLLNKAGQEANIKLQDMFYKKDKPKLVGKPAKETDIYPLEDMEIISSKLAPKQATNADVVQKQRIPLKPKDSLETQKKDNILNEFATEMYYFSRTMKPGQHQVVDIPSDRLYMEKTKSGDVFHLQNQQEATNEGTGLLIAFDVKKQSLTINGKPAEDYQGETLEKARALLNAMSSYLASKDKLFNPEQHLKAIENAYVEFKKVL